MISHEELHRLADIELSHPGAVSFYFQPQPPQDQSHRGEAILVKDLVRDALRRSEREGSHSAVRADLDRVLALAEQLHGNHARAKVVFACAEKDIWQEFDLPPQLRQTELFVNSRFHLAPLAAFLEDQPRCAAVLIDRERARIFDYSHGHVSERAAIVSDTPRRVKSDGFAGYDAGHRERRVDNGAMRHFKEVAEQLRDQAAAGAFDVIIIGCRDEAWPEIEPHLHNYVRQRLAGRFTIDPALASAEDVRAHARRLLEERRLGEQQALLREVIGEASRNGRGSLGLRRVLDSLERGEVQTLLLGDHFAAAVAECTHCAHLDTRMVPSCAVCGKATRELQDVTDALVLRALRNRIALVHVTDDAFARAGNIGALLRFRADQNTNQLAG